MPYLGITSQSLPASARCAIAGRLTDTIVDLFFNPRSPLARIDLRERTTVHFTPYGDDELFIDGRTPQQREAPDVPMELSRLVDAGASPTQGRTRLTPVVMELFGIEKSDADAVNIRFHSYPPSDFAAGGQLLCDRMSDRRPMRLKGTFTMRYAVR
jgi:phenylpyruvate tautomerase PptA (4-oxalocrotonate tautomerase family)